MFLEWIKNIILFIVFSSMVFFLLPDEKYRKYMQTAVGFVMTILVIHPLLKAGGLGDVLSFDYYYDAAENATGDSDRRYYTDVMETMIQEHIQDEYQTDSEVELEFDDGYAIQSIRITLFLTERENVADGESLADDEILTDNESRTNDEIRTEGDGSETDRQKLEQNVRRSVAGQYKVDEALIDIAFK